MIRLILPYHLRVLAGVDGEVQIEVPGPVTIPAVLNALEARYPTLRGTVRDPLTLRRRPLIRFFACEEDHSNDPDDQLLPPSVRNGVEPLWIIGAIAGG